MISISSRGRVCVFFVRSPRGLFEIGWERPSSGRLALSATTLLFGGRCLRLMCVSGFRSLRDEAEPYRCDHCVHTRRRAQSQAGAQKVMSYRLGPDLEEGGDLGGIEAVGNKLQHLLFTRGEMDGRGRF